MANKIETDKQEIAERQKKIDAQAKLQAKHDEEVAAEREKLLAEAKKKGVKVPKGTTNPEAIRRCIDEATGA